MKKSMVIIQNEIILPQDIINWAEIHSVPIVDASADISIYNFVIEYSNFISKEYLEYIYCHSHNIPAIIGITEHLVIREIGNNDLDAYQNLINKYPEVISDKTLIDLDKQIFMERHLAYIKYSYHFLGYGIWGIFLKTNDASQKNYSQADMIGIAGLDGACIPSLCYALFEEYHGKGYAFEAICKIMEYAVEILELQHIKLDVQINNVSSLKFAQKIQKIYPDILQINVLDL